MTGIVRQVVGAGLFLLAGYIFVRFSYFRRWSVEHLRTDRFALHILAYSLVFFTLGVSLADPLPDWTLKGFEGWRNKPQDFGVTPVIANAIAFAMIGALADNTCVLVRMRAHLALLDAHEPRDKRRTPLAWLRRIRSRMRLAALFLFMYKSNDVALRTIFRAFAYQKLLVVTLKSQKVYVGQLSLPNLDPVHPLTSLKLVPVVSGYRDAATKKVVFTTSYKDMEQKIAQIQDESSGSAVVNDKFNPLRTNVWELFLSESSTARIDVEDFGVVLPWAEIESLTIFDPNIYNAFEDVDSSADNVSANVAPREAASASHEATSGDHQAASAHLLSSPEHILSAAGPTRQHSRTRRRRMRITTAPRHGARPRHRSAGQHSGTLTLTASPPWDVSL